MVHNMTRQKKIYRLLGSPGANPDLVLAYNKKDAYKTYGRSYGNIAPSCWVVYHD